MFQELKMNMVLQGHLHIKSMIIQRCIKMYFVLILRRLLNKFPVLERNVVPYI